jgi:diguanylate cyclase (GGDEF)-like protein|tara:strand:+ start:152907 stop:154559 length:1653 start_codon:yes stop_codon:yes gene_type:complete
VSAPAAAQEGVQLEFCTIGLSADAPPPAPERWQGRDDGRGSGGANCGADRFTDQSPMVWANATGAFDSLPDDELFYVTDPSAFDELTLIASYADGTRRTINYGPDVAASSWVPAVRMAFALPPHDAPLTGLVVGVERPRSLTIFSAGSLQGRTDLADLRFKRGMALAFILGLIVLPLLFNGAFFTVLRERFIIWHGLMVVSVATYALSSSGLIFMIFPDLPLLTRWHLNNWAFVLGVASASMFAIHFTEAGKIPQWLCRLLQIILPLLCIATIVTLHTGDWARVTGRIWWYYSFVPWLALYVVAIGIALWRGSRAAQFIFLSSLGIVLTSLERLLRYTGHVEQSADAEMGLYFALVIEAVVTSLGVADRFLTMRRQRDKAEAREAQLDHLAHTDGLTGLMNRRAFERECARWGPDIVVILDIDHFKAVNDTYGHRVGDDALTAVAGILRAAAGRRLIACRLGGEEFALALRGASPGAAKEQVDRLRERISRGADLAVPELKNRLTVSAGIAAANQEPLSAILARAEREGRDRSCMAEENVSSAKEQAMAA